MKAKGDYLNLVYSDQMVFEIVRRETDWLERWPKATQGWGGGTSGLSPLRSDVSCDGQAGRLDHREAVAKGTQN